MNDTELYVASCSDPEPEWLARIDRDAHLHLLRPRMSSGHIQGRLLKMLTQMIGPKVVVELGTFVGYSALCIAEGLQPDAVIHTIEADDELEDIIRHNLTLTPYGERVRLHIADARAELLQFEDESVDMMFIDADKRQYTEYYKLAKRIVRHGGFILADNTLWDGHVTEADRHDAHTQGVRAFNDMVAADPEVQKVMLPLRDGLTLIRKL